MTDTPIASQMQINHPAARGRITGGVMHMTNLMVAGSPEWREQQESFALFDRKMQFQWWVMDMIEARCMPEHIRDIWLYDYIGEERPKPDEDEPPQPPLRCTETRELPFSGPVTLTVHTSDEQEG
jgi:hypothetical protein